MAETRTIRVRYNRKLDDVTARRLARMTPLGWQANAAEAESDADALLERMGPTVTVDLTILIGRRPRQV